MTSIFFAGFAALEDIMDGLGGAMATGLKVGGVVAALILSFGLSAFCSVLFFLLIDYKDKETDKSSQEGWITAGLFLGIGTWIALIITGPRLEDHDALGVVLILGKMIVSTLTSSAAIAFCLGLMVWTARRLFDGPAAKKETQVDQVVVAAPADDLPREESRPGELKAA